MNRYTALFQRGYDSNRIAFIPFVMLGDPNYQTSLQVINTLVESGVNGLELGIPFSDPVADGPVIQGASIRALEQGMTPTRAFELLGEIRARHPDIAIGLLLYANLVYRKGIDEFYNQCKTIAIDSVLIADVPLRESQPFDGAAEKFGIDSIHILPPEPAESLVDAVANQSKGYTYVLGRAGVTGTDLGPQMPDRKILMRLKNHGAAPAVMGFGISRPEHVVAAKQAGFQGVISGSAVVKIIESNIHDETKMMSELKEFAQSMLASC